MLKNDTAVIRMVAGIRHVRKLLYCRKSFHSGSSTDATQVKQDETQIVERFLALLHNTDKNHREQLCRQVINITNKLGNRGIQLNAAITTALHCISRARL